LGSLNFTSQDTKNKYEARIQADDPNAEMKIKEEFD